MSFGHNAQGDDFTFISLRPQHLELDDLILGNLKITALMQTQNVNEPAETSATRTG
jgi:hypothetical protein